MKGVSPAAMRQLDHYDWPGNVRELRNVIERATISRAATRSSPRTCRCSPAPSAPISTPAAPSNGVTIVPGMTVDEAERS